MKSLFMIALISASALCFGASEKIELPWTMDAASVQATLKGLLVQEMERDKASKYPRKQITGDNRKVVLKDDKSIVTCREQNAGGNGGGATIQVQEFSCTIEKK